MIKRAHSDMLFIYVMLPHMVDNTQKGMMGLRMDAQLG